MADFSLSVPQAYHIMNKSDSYGIQGYEIDKKYVDPLQIIKDRQYAKIKKGEKNRKHVIKRGNFLDDETKITKNFPGPGQYKCLTEWSEKAKLKIKYADRMTYIEETMKREKKEKKPAPGHYNVEKTQKQVEEEKKKLKSRKIPYQDRINYLDDIEYTATTTPGVGMYNPRKRAKTEVTSAVSKKPEEWRKKHQDLDKKKPPKCPDMTTYHPIPSTYELFEKATKVKENKNLPGKIDRFKTMASGSGLNPTKYNIIQEWRGKDNAKPKKERHGLEVLSKISSKSVYYN